MFPPDKPAILREARRVLTDGGWLFFNVWGSLDNNPYARAIWEVVTGVFSANPPRFFDVPYGFHDVGFWSDLLRAHGFTDLKHEVVTLEARSETAEQFAIGLTQGSPLSHELRECGGDFDQIAEAVTAALVRLGGEAPFRSPMQAIVFTARAG